MSFTELAKRETCHEGALFLRKRHRDPPFDGCNTFWDNVGKCNSGGRRARH
jgi:hypothetical protein